MQNSLGQSRKPVLAPVTSSLSGLPWWAIVMAATGLLLIYFILSDDNYRQTFLFMQVGVVTTSESH